MWAKLVPRARLSHAMTGWLLAGKSCARHSNLFLIYSKLNLVWWSGFVILSTQETEAGELQGQDQSGLMERPCLKTGVVGETGW